METVLSRDSLPWHFFAVWQVNTGSLPAVVSLPYGISDRMCSLANKKAKLEFKQRRKLFVSAVAAINECLLF